MEVAVYTTRQLAAIRVSQKAWKDYPNAEFEHGIRHEILHVFTHGILNEYLLQANRLPSEVRQEYIDRYKAQLETVVEKLAHIDYKA